LGGQKLRNFVNSSARRIQKAKTSIRRQSFWGVQGAETYKYNDLGVSKLRSLRTVIAWEVYSSKINTNTMVFGV
jgi:hypothetical protein